MSAMDVDCRSDCFLDLAQSAGEPQGFFVSRCPKVEDEMPFWSLWGSISRGIRS